MFAVLAVTLIGTLAAFQLPLSESLRLLFSGAFGDKFGIARMLVKMSPLLLTGLGMAVAWRAGMYNIGGEGQFIIGGLLAAAVFKLCPTLPPILLNVVLIVSCMAGGLSYAWLAAWLFTKRGVQVVISTILLNFIAIQILGWAVAGPLRKADGSLPQTDSLPQAAMFFRPDGQMDFHVGIFLGLIAAVFLTVYLFRTKSGFQTRLTGENAFAARAARIDASKVQMRAMLLSGALCGLAAASDYIGVSGQIDKGFSQQWGFLGIPVALVGGLHPIGILGSAAYFGALFAGSDNLARFTSSGSTIVYVIQGAAVLGWIGFKSWSDERVPVGAVE